MGHNICKRINKPMLGILASVVVTAALTSHGGITSIIVTDTPSDLDVTGTWSLPDANGSLLSVPGLTWWSVDVSAQTIPFGGGSFLNLLQVDETHLVPPPATTASQGVGLLDLAGNGGTISSILFHGLGDDRYVFSASIGPAGTYNWELTGSHPGSQVPEPGSYICELMAGLALIGFTSYRRNKRFKP